MRAQVTPTSKRQMSSLLLVSQETLRGGGGSYEKIKKIGLMSEATALHVHHTIFVHFFTVLHDYVMKMPNFAFYEERKQLTTKFYFLYNLAAVTNVSKCARALTWYKQVLPKVKVYIFFPGAGRRLDQRSKRWLAVVSLWPFIAQLPVWRNHCLRGRYWLNSWMENPSWKILGNVFYWVTLLDMCSIFIYILHIY